MKYDNETLRETLASEYVLGTLRGLARKRFKRLMKYDAGLRHMVERWESRLYPLAQAAPDIEPPQRVWNNVRARIAPRSRRAPGLWERVAFWRNFGIISSALAVLLAVYLAVAPQPEAPPATVALLADAKGQPALLVSWPKQAAQKREIRVAVLALQDTPANNSLQLWLLPAPEKPPVSMGLVSNESRQTLALPAAVAAQLGDAWAVAISLEPKGGSPTGQPTGPVLFQGRCVKVS